MNLRAIIDYVSDRNKVAADKLLSTIEACAERIPAHPYMHRTGRVPGTREAVVHPNYILIYQVGIDSVEVLNVIHSRRPYPPGDDQPE